MAHDPSLPGASPGLGTEREATQRPVVLANLEVMAGPMVIDASETRDPTNTPVTLVQSGVLFGQITANKKWAPSIIGTLTSAYTGVGTSNTSMQVSAATATEIVRRIGSSGTFKLTGPPTSGGTVATTTVTYSAVNTSTGVITVTDPDVNAIAGSLIQDTDGSETIKTFLYHNGGWPIRVTDQDDNNRDQEGSLVSSGQIDASLLINYGTDSSIQAYIKDALNAVGHFTFDDDYGL